MQVDFSQQVFGGGVRDPDENCAAVVATDLVAQTMGGQSVGSDNGDPEEIVSCRKAQCSCKNSTDHVIEEIGRPLQDRDAHRVVDSRADRNVARLGKKQIRDQASEHDGVQGIDGGVAKKGLMQVGA